MLYLDNNLNVSQGNAPTPASHQVLVAVKSFGINRADLLQRAGKYPPPEGESSILGLEVMGEVVGFGPSAKRFALGDRVMGLVPGGGYAQQVVVSEQHLMPVPTGLDNHAAAGLSEIYLTAFQALDWLADVQQGERVLIHAGASGVGIACIQLCKLFGCDVSVTVGDEEKAALCRGLGARLAINYNKDDFVEVVKEEWGQVNVVIDVVGGDYISKNIEVLGLDGRIVLLSILGGRFAEKLDLARVLKHRITLTGSTLRNRSHGYKAKLVKQFESDVLPHFTSGLLNVPIDGVYPAHELSLAHARLADNLSKGKLIGYWP